MPSPEVLQALDELHKELNKLEPALKLAETAVQITDAVKELPRQHAGFIDELKKDYIASINNVENKITELFEKIDVTNTEVRKSILATNNNIGETLKGIKFTADKVLEYYDHIQRIDFPNRLEKIDSTISGINIGIQNLQSIVMETEKVIKLEYSNITKGQNIHKIILLISVALNIAILVKIFILS